MTGHYAKGSLLLLPAQTRRVLAGLSFVVCEDVCGVQPLGVVVQQRPLLVEAVGAELVLAAVHQLARLAAVVHRRPEIVGAVSEGAVGAVLHAVSPAD